MCHISHWGKHLKHLGGNTEPDCSYLAVAVQSTWFDFCEATQDRKWRLSSEHPLPKDCALYCDSLCDTLIVAYC